MPEAECRPSRDPVLPRRKRGALALTCALLSACGGGAPDPLPYDGIGAYVEAERFVGTIVVKQGDRILLRASHGFADAARQTPNALDTRYCIASLTKAFTALGVVALKGEDRIAGYDAALSDILPGYPRGDELTLRHLLTHRSGIPDYRADADPDRAYTPGELVDLFKDRPLAFAPGEGFDYSNANYVLLGQVIETLGGEPYAAFLRSRILVPFGLADTGYGDDEPAGQRDALGYADLAQTRRANHLDMSIPYAAGALVSTADDLVAFAESFADPARVSAEDAAEIFGDASYGFGWVISRLAGRPVRGHTGGIDGFSAMLVVFPEQDAIVVALSNVENEQAKLQRIAATIAEHEF